MGLPSVTYNDFLINVRDELKDNLSNVDVTCAIEPYLKPYGDTAALFVLPEGIEYESAAGAATDTKRAHWVWYKAKVTGYVALTDANFESGLIGVGSVKGIVSVLEDAFQVMEDNFMSLAHLREARVEWDTDTFFPAVVPAENNNFYLAAGSFTYRVKLRLIEATEQQASPPFISDVTVTDVTSTTATITWTTNQSSTSKIKYGTTGNAHSFIDEETDSTMTTSHTITLTGLPSSTQHWFKPFSTNANSIEGKTPDIYDFTTGYSSSVEITNVVLTVGRNDVLFEYDTSEDTKCEIYRREPPVTWLKVIDEDTEHPTHSHTDSGLTQNTTYHYYIKVLTDEGDHAVAPAGAPDTSYIIVTTGETGEGEWEYHYE